MQIVLAVCLGIGVVLAEQIWPGAKGLDISPAEKAWVESYTAGVGLRRSMVAYCAAVLEQAGYDKEHFR